MEKYLEVINQIREIRGLKNAFNTEYDSFMDSVLLTFYNMKAFSKLDNENGKTWKSFEFICNMNDIKYDFKSYGIIELYY